MKYLTLNLFVVLLGCDGNGPTPVSDASVDSNVRPDAIADTSVADTHIVVPDGGTRALGPNDISILFPFDRGELWPASAASFSEALFGEINPTRFPGLVGNGSGGIFPNLDANAQYASLRVVSLRIEPCSAGCAAQLRFILQSKGTSTFRDGAVHVVHNLNAQQFVELRARVLELQVVSPENADPVLKVNPALAAQGLGGAFGSALRQRISASASTVTLHRVTFMTRGGARESEWEFGGLEIANGAVTTTVTIPGYAASTRFQFL